MKKERLIGLDIFRIICVFIVCLFHISVHLNSDFKLFKPFIQMGAIFMTAFFMLSGFLMYETNKNNDLTNIKNYTIFLKKRIKNIIPLYIVTIIIYYIFHWNNSDLFLLPIELLCLQSLFPKLFKTSHNSGTWFISCIMICYIIYPLLQSFLLQIKNKYKLTLILLASFILLYIPFIVTNYKLDKIYINPFFRLLEFFIGACLASIKPLIYNQKKLKKIIYNWFSIFIAFSIMFILVTSAVNNNFYLNDYMCYNIFCLPFFMFIILGLSEVKFNCLSNFKIIKYLSNISYCLFLAQLFSNDLSKLIIDYFQIVNNKIIILIGFTSCIIIGIILYEIFEKNIKKNVVK